MTITITFEIFNVLVQLLSYFLFKKKTITITWLLPLTITIFFTTYDMLKMLVKLMIPLSIVEKRRWKECIQTLDLAFNVPTVQTIKASLYTIAKDIECKITLQLKSIDYI